MRPAALQKAFPPGKEGEHRSNELLQHCALDGNPLKVSAALVGGWGSSVGVFHHFLNNIQEACVEMVKQVFCLKRTLAMDLT